MIKSRNIRWAEHATHMGQMKNAYQILIGSLNGESHSKDADIYMGG
jgi:hypothetical protein